MALLRSVSTAPIWVSQAVRLALTAPRLPEAAGARSGRLGNGRLRLLILGDSSAAGVGVQHQDQALAGQLIAALADLEPDWHLQARSGATTAEALRWLAQMPVEPRHAAVVALGVNDVTRAVPLARWLDRQRQLAEMLTARFGIERIYLSAVPPMGAFPALPQPLRSVLGARAGRFDAALADLVETLPGVTRTPFDAALLEPAMMAADGYHPGPQIYRLWAAELARRIRADFPAI